MNQQKARKTRYQDEIRPRGKEPSRLETFSDAVFAFALTLIILSLEVPKSFTELYTMMKGAISFGACFLILFSIWYTQNTFFRKFGLNDRYTVFLNGFLLFTVLIYIYPLKFLSVLIFNGSTYMDHGVSFERIRQVDTPLLMGIYSLGYAIIYFLFFLMYKNALAHAQELELTPREIHITKTITGAFFLNALVGLLSILIALILPANISGLSGYVYFLIPVIYYIWFAYRKRKGVAA